MVKKSTKYAVMASQAEHSKVSLNDFPTPPWATRALTTYVIPGKRIRQTCLEPACGRGHMAMALLETFGIMYVSDIAKYDSPVIPAYNAADFLTTDLRFDWIITNPPFRLAEEFSIHAIKHAKIGVAMLVRTAFLEGQKRWLNLFSRWPPSIVAQFSERVAMVEGRYDPEASTATSYCWLVWKKRDSSDETKFVWIPPCKHKLVRPGDDF